MTTLIDSAGVFASVINADPSGSYALACDIDFAGATFADTPIPVFSGHFDGRGFSISGLRIEDSALRAYGSGLFGTIEPGGVVRNFTLVAPYIRGNNGSVASVCGVNRGVIRNVVVVDADVSGALRGCSVGGFVARNMEDGYIADSSAGGVATVTERNCYLGGFVGYNWGGIVADCVSSVITSNETTTGAWQGGFVGANGPKTGLDSAIMRCESTGDVIAPAVKNAGNYVGGFCGIQLTGSIAQCWCSGAVSGGSSVGGFVGVVNNNGLIRTSYASGALSGGLNFVGGFAGDVMGRVVDCYALGTVSGVAPAYVGGFAGRINGGEIASSYSVGDATAGGFVGASLGQSTATARVNSLYYPLGGAFPGVGYDRCATDPVGVPLADLVVTLPGFADGSWKTTETVGLPQLI